VTDEDGKPVAGAQVAIFSPFQMNNTSWKRTQTNGAFSLTWTLQRFGMQQGGPQLIVRDSVHNLGATAELTEDTTNLTVKLKPAVTATGVVKNLDDTPLAGARISVQLKTANNSQPFNDQVATTDAQGVFEVKGLAPDATYEFVATAKGRGQGQQPVKNDPGSNRVELLPFVLKLTDHVVAGQVRNEDDKPVPGVNVSVSGLDQPNSTMTTDSKGRFHFQVCEGMVHLNANGQNGYAQASPEAGDTNVVMELGQSYMGDGNSKPHKLTGTVTDPGGHPLAGAQLAVFPRFQFGNNGSAWKKSATNGAFNLKWSLQPWQRQMGGTAMLVVHDMALNLAATADLAEATSNLDVQLKPALTAAGVVLKEDGSPLAGAQIEVQIKSENNFSQLNDQPARSDAQGRYQLKCLPPTASYIVVASAKGRGKSRQEFQGSAETNRVKLSPIVLQPADRVLAGQVVDEKGKPVSGASVSLNGANQPDGYMATDSKGRFHFQVCEGEVSLWANSPQGGFTQATAQAGDSNVVLALGQQGGMRVVGGGARAARKPARQEPLKGTPLPDLTSVNLFGGVAPAGKPVLLCLFDAGQRASRQMMRQLNDKAGALSQQGITVLGAQALITGGEIFNEWRGSSPVTFPLGRVTAKTEKTKWVLDISTLPCLILTDGEHHVVAQGFEMEELDEEIKKLAK
jgi:protocatechuate 3,4-dioxygenase beta subunit